jgi:serine/threonine protein kinase
VYNPRSSKSFVAQDQSPAMKICPDCQRSYPTSFVVCPQDGARLTEPLEWSEGTVIRGKYRIVAKIGEGGMGAVYKAMHMHFNEACALKVMAPNLANDAGLVKRFGREAIIARKLRHINAVKVEDFDETEDGRPFIVMEYIEGQSLKSLMTAAGPLPVARACSIIKQAAAALDAAHQLGLIHRDIKPDNIVLVVSNGREVAKVLDFGIAKIQGANANTSGMALTATGMVIGTPPYMSPEQARGADSEGIDGRSDIYSLGVVMYQMLTGILPLKGDTPLDMLFAQIQTPPTPIHQARPGLRIPAAVGDVVMKCLEKDPARRPQSGRELIEELELCEKAQPAASHSPSVKDFSESTTVADTPGRFPLAGRVSSATTFGSEPASPTYVGTEPNPVPAVLVMPDPPVSPVPSVNSLPALSPASSPPLPRNESSLSRTAILIRIVIFLLVAGGGWYYYHRSSTDGRQSVPAQNTGNVPGGAEPSGTQPSSSQASPPSAGASDAQPSPTPSGSSQTSAPASQPKGTADESAPSLSAEEKAARAKKVSSTTSLGDLYYENGEFDNAIKEYQLGLDADPSNKSLRDKIDRARKAKDTAPSAKP